MQVHPTSRPSHWQTAAKLLEERKLKPEEHVLLQENLATYLTHLDGVEEGDNPHSRWTIKMQRDLEKPYSDAEVLSHVDDLQSDLKNRLAEMPVYPSQVYVTGSFMRGRLGDNSDLDAFFVFPEEARAMDLSKLLTDAREDSVIAFPLFEDNPGMVRSLLIVGGARLAISKEAVDRPGALREEYARTLEQRGISVEGDRCRRTTEWTERRETHKLFEWITSRTWKESNTHQDKWDSLHGPGWKGVCNRTALEVAGRLAGLPGVEWAVNRGMDLIVKQEERQLLR
jgi:predicted nucleotidyltransferase